MTEFRTRISDTEWETRACLATDVRITVVRKNRGKNRKYNSGRGPPSGGARAATFCDNAVIDHAATTHAENRAAGGNCEMT